MTLNPTVHIPPMGFLALAVFGICYGLMPVDPTRMRGRYADTKVSLAGPAVNLLLAIVGAVACGLMWRLELVTQGGPSDNVQQLLFSLAWVNAVLLVFNLLPAYPLDGSRVLADLWPAYRQWVDRSIRDGWHLYVFVVVFLTAPAWMGGVIEPVFWAVERVAGGGLVRS